jgi:membrane protein implicated in regulation of membrane protease activity
MKPFPRYLLFQTPGWLTVSGVMGFLHVSAGVSLGISAGVVALMIALDFALYPFFRHSYASRAQVGPETLVGQRGRVVRPLDPEGFVRIRGERWKARMIEGDRVGAEGDTIEVLGVRGLTVLVRRVEQ